MMIDSYLAYFVLGITSVGFALLGLAHARRRAVTVESYVTDRGHAGYLLSTASVVASVAGAWILFSPAETATWAGLAGLLGYGIGQAAPLIAFGLMGPRMRQLIPHGHSLTEYARNRFGQPVYVFVISIMVFYMSVFLVAELTAIALAFQFLAGIPLFVTALVVAATTVAYTCYGGLRTSIFTDGLQFLLIVPLLVLITVAALSALGGFDASLQPVRNVAPALLSLRNASGVEFGLTLIIAILAANMFHQGFWQRVYACKDERVLRRSFFAGGVLVIPAVVFAGFLGLLAIGQGVAEAHSSVALFHLVTAVMPKGAILAVLVLALALVMSSMDTLLNAIAAAVTTDLAHFRPGVPAARLLRYARVLTAGIALPAVFVASKGYSVLYLFLIADLVCAGAVFPVFYGLYARRLTGTACLTSCLLGIGVGALFFPKPDFSPWLQLPFAGRFLVSFGLAFGVSCSLAVAYDLWAAFKRRTAVFDFNRLGENIQLIEG